MTSPAPAPAATETEPVVDPATRAEVEELVASKPVVIFALEWCEFTWSVRNMFAEAGIDYESVDLDSVAFLDGDPGRSTRYRAVLRDMTGAPTIPQVFVGGQSIGGATETFDAFNSGELQAALAKASVAFDPGMECDAYSFLPKWLHAR
ncbi:glutaredoxin domain-containing protein [Tropicimonas sediminicola]|uniref:glutaredoxin domain-containing protein n=1 Tax=Tropicimonas sediminicola TaxID=1031541 RepID=UPI002481DDFB|nr:glutaredoxin domain-containing protein [Tropicimonas sediminicola]